MQESERDAQDEGMYIYLWLTHVFIWQKPTQHCKAVILQLKIKNKIKGINKIPQFTDST